MVYAGFWTRRVVGVAFFVALGCVSHPGAAGAQQLRGQVLRGDSGVARVPVELHRVTRNAAGLVSTTTTNPAGWFSFDLPAPEDTSFTVVFATVEYLGVRYFGPPLHPGDSISAYTISVYDTVSVAGARDAIQVVRRDLILLPERSGGWEVNEVIRLRNRTDRTLVAESGAPTWEFRIPTLATDFEVGDGEFAASEIVRTEDRVLVLLPIMPGGREVFIRYRLPAAVREMRLAAESGEMNLFVQQPAPELRVVGFAPPEPMTAEGHEFLLYRQASRSGTAELVISWNRVGPPLDPTAAAIAVTTLFLLMGIVAAVAHRRSAPGTRSAPPPAPGVHHPEVTEVGTVSASPRA